jgi:hypothetical protein
MYDRCVSRDYCVFRQIMCIMCALIVRAGLWKAWFLRMFRGEMLPKMPKVPAEFHKKNKVTVPYTLEEMRIRNANYDIKKATWDKTMQV